MVPLRRLRGERTEPIVIAGDALRVTRALPGPTTAKPVRGSRTANHRSATADPDTLRGSESAIAGWRRRTATAGHNYRQVLADLMRYQVYLLAATCCGPWLWLTYRSARSTVIWIAKWQAALYAEGRLSSSHFGLGVWCAEWGQLHDFHNVLRYTALFDLSDPVVVCI